MEQAKAETPVRAALLHTTLLGTPVRVDRSWVPGALFTAVACGTVAWVVLGSVTPAGAAVLGLAMAAALTASLLVHELAHAYVARRAGIEIEEIRVFAGGALCRRRQQIDAPRELFAVAAAGPLASAMLGIVTLCVVGVAQPLGLPLPAAAGLWFVAFVNGLIAVSNMLPVFPFDGGKLVHAMFWRRTKDRGAATARLRHSGREFSRGVVSMGIIVIAFGGDVLIGVVLALFGVYLLKLPAPS